MPKEIFMPKLSSTMEIGTLLQWFKEEGDSVEIGEPLFEIMTDKINIEVEAYDDGIFLKKYYEADDQIPVNAVIGYIGEANEQVPSEPPAQADEDSSESSESSSPASSSSSSTEAPKTSDEKVRATPAARKTAKDHHVVIQEVSGTGPKGRVQKRDVEAVVQSSEKDRRVSPLAEKVAAREGIDLAAVSGSGAHGKIMKSDVQAATQTAEASPVKTQKLAGMRKVIADRMSQSAFTAPHVTLTSEIDMTKAKEVRQQLLPAIEKETGYRLSFTEIIIHAVSHVLTRHPQINMTFEQNELHFHEDVHIGLAVAVKDGLMVPVISHANQKGLKQLTKEAKEIGRNARDQKLLPDQLKGSTFTISNLGMYAIDTFTPIINQPEVAILGVGRIQDKPVAVDGEIQVRPMMGVSLSFDHRVVDGAPAAAFLTDLKKVLEQPFELLM
ncbi:dihydrolipoamide acetyltransferase family protein [Bacillus pumilus]|uniref:dihydrolipoamide acetyltransferase family protein n=1 Tax=Bacillus TaxID=1386 RepID=UPI0007176E78|nr:dihydrolipoamide acetyltransferase family protein [Bacillus pumilus]AMM96951.1 branched-chain alpha-keto acid dehydrogenase subunit E2 [Bacillus pumilus]KRU17031.1 branched-chain alpha-keto acid dehydrogenase subunit E2 [Bacillus pumilus]MCY7679368.1 2-oxo acid dehydrogenase subunit E2 [Bacillus pumilus]MDH3151008.1 dihydrolipoamide acetyltransferase family protein [Bacillus pumilus]